MATSSEGPAAAAVKAAILGSGKPAIYAAVATFVAELRAGGPMRAGAAQPKAAPAKTVDAVAQEAAGGCAPAAATGSAAAAADQAAAAADKQQQKEEKEAGGGSGHSIEMRESFYARASGALPPAVQPRTAAAAPDSPLLPTHPCCIAAAATASAQVTLHAPPPPLPSSPHPTRTRRPV